QCHPPVPISSATHLCHSAVPPVCPAVPPTSATHHCCPLVPPISAAYQCQLISATYQYRLSVPISAAYPCHLISAHQCCLSVPISTAYQRTSVKEKNYLFAKFHIRYKEKLFFQNV
ncbi:unnamed protein product, partial [Staurois parvus]